MGGGPLKQDLGNILLADAQTVVRDGIFYLFRDLPGPLTFTKCLRKHSGFSLLLSVLGAGCEAVYFFYVIWCFLLHHMTNFTPPNLHGFFYFCFYFFGEPFLFLRRAAVTHSVIFRSSIFPFPAWF